MSDKLRSYIKNNKEKFETSEPSDELWNKIDSKLEVNSSASKSKWISGLKYFGFGASALVIAIYFISQNINTSSSNTLAQHTKDSALNSSGVWVKTNQNGFEASTTENSLANTENKEGISSGKNPKEGGTVFAQNSNENARKDSVINNVAENAVGEEKVEMEPSTVKEEKPVVSSSSNKNKRKVISIPEAPSELNTYSATLYDGSSLCEVIQAYKFPGKVNMDDERNFQGHRILKTVPCSKLESMGNVKAVWLKGKISRKLILSVSEGLKNIVLEKSDGRKISPVAVSHYYKGLGVISDYTGKHFEMTFKDNVELILFFKDAEDGDKVMIDGKIEAVVITK